MKPRRWAHVSHFTDAPGGPVFRGSCLRCPWQGPIRKAPAHQLTSDELEAARNGYGLVAKVAAAAHSDLADHLIRRHGADVRRTIPEGHPSLRFDLKEAT